MKTAIVTASYNQDFERCKLLCETIDEHVSGFTNHYILVEPRDVALFRQLAGPRRIIVDERELLPSWLHVFPDPTTWGRRRIWLSLKTKPLRGWHVQQLRRIAIARYAQDDAFFYVDSDVAFVRPYNCNSLWQEDRLRLLVRPGALANPQWPEHLGWSANTTKLLGVETSSNTLNDYIGTLIGWRRDTILSMCDLIEQKNGMHWAAALGKMRRFSECMLYGRYVDDVLNGTGHFHDTTDLCRVQWFAPPPTEDEFRTFIAELAPQQVAIGIQSFLDISVDDIRRIIGA
ncbi:hypothetical protein KUG47_12435 [Falsochrobactrum sp. TDYN1]|uniref:Uncharacterized protein n=1 Tax=Falsochrobactrum tianjinense TaxID=2706015 RepID=A0A949UVH8_9HYPH|nr:DUF6492 family protein [Falsochrobactrum sp. TDYN1]MBV2144301.1 hypothetical protein [Falsochrobactrum sp. TDYN1]